MQTRLALALLLLALLVPTSAHPEPLRCRRAIVGAEQTFSRRALAALANCEARRVAGRLAAGTSCIVERRTVAKMAGARRALEAAVAKGCGGRDHRCGTADDEALAAIGWDAATCPGVARSDACRGTIAHCGDVAACVACVGTAALGTVSDYLAGAPRPTTAGARRCAGAIGREASRFLGKEAKLLARCWDLRLRGRYAGSCPGDGVTAAAIAAAETRRRTAICRACGGHDGRCDGAGDIAASDVAPQRCPDGGPRACGGVVTDVAGVGECINCLATPGLECTALLSASGDAAYGAECGAPRPSTTTTTLPPPACCGPFRMVLETPADDGSFTYGPFRASALPAGLRLTVDVGPPDAGCRHDAVIPPGGFEQPAFCVVPPLGLTGRLYARGCAAGAAAGRGTVWDGAAPNADADLTLTGDTSDGVCNPLGQTCGPIEGGAGDNVRGAERIARGDGIADGAGLHMTLEVPVQEVSWSDHESGCPDADGVPDDVTDGDGDIARLNAIMRMTTGHATARFADVADVTVDGCSAVGVPAVATAVDGGPAAGPCCVVGQTLTLAGAAPLFGGMIGDTVSTMRLPLRVAACEPWPGPTEATCDALAGGGRVVTAFERRGDHPRALGLDPAGRITAAGRVRHVGGQKEVDGVGLARYLPDGRLDLAFGAEHSGRAWVQMDGVDPSMGMTRQADEKLVLAGTVVGNGSADAAFLVRLDGTGLLDGDFGVGGVVVTRFGAVGAGLHGVVAAGGRIVAAGQRCDGSRCSPMLAGFDAGGGLDPTFGSQGLVVFGDFSGRFDRVARDSTGALVAAGIVEADPGSATFVVRTDEDGTVDMHFGDGASGAVLAPGGPHGVAGLGILGNHGIVVAVTFGVTWSTGSDGYRAGLLRFTSAGTLDTGFASDGIAVPALAGTGWSMAEALDVDSEERFVIAGGAGRSDAADSDFLLLRLTGDGTLDPSFGNGGIVLTDFHGRQEGAFALARQPDGKLVAAGDYREMPWSGDVDFALARYAPDGALDPAFSGDECAWPVGTLKAEAP
ncbi:MAG: hypothetical protein U0807_14205 [Candidatus Binatia bacterium]